MSWEEYSRIIDSSVHAMHCTWLDITYAICDALESHIDNRKKSYWNLYIEPALLDGGVFQIIGVICNISELIMGVF